MKNICIDLKYIKKQKININEFLALHQLYSNNLGVAIPFNPTKGDLFKLLELGLISMSGNEVKIEQKGIDLIEGKSALRNYEELAEKLRVLYPHGKKNGKWPWRGYSKDIASRLRKLDKDFGLSSFSDKKIELAVENYVSSFSLKDRDAGMQLLQYFLEKGGNSSLLACLEVEPIVQDSSSMDVEL